MYSDRDVHTRSRPTSGGARPDASPLLAVLGLVLLSVVLVAVKQLDRASGACSDSAARHRAAGRGAPDHDRVCRVRHHPRSHGRRARPARHRSARRRVAGWVLRACAAAARARFGAPRPNRFQHRSSCLRSLPPHHRSCGCASTRSRWSTRRSIVQRARSGSSVATISSTRRFLVLVSRRR